VYDQRVKLEDKLRIHRQAMFWQNVSESRRRADELEATMRQVSSTARMKADEFQQLHAQAIRHAQLS
jgi:hypothetical protein